MSLKWPYENPNGYVYVDGVSSLELAKKEGGSAGLHERRRLRLLHEQPVQLKPRPVDVTVRKSFEDLAWGQLP